LDGRTEVSPGSGGIIIKTFPVHPQMDLIHQNSLSSFKACEWVEIIKLLTSLTPVTCSSTSGFDTSLTTLSVPSVHVLIIRLICSCERQNFQICQYHLLVSSIYPVKWQEKFEHTKGVIRSHNSPDK
jgi:hypothetical protein